MIRPAQPREPVMETRLTQRGGRACSFRWICSRWCMLGTEDEPSGPDAWAARSWRAGTRRAYAQKLAKIAEFQEASGETSLARVLAGFLAARAEVGERQSTLRGYNAAVRAAEDFGLIGPTVQQLHKHIAQAASKVGLQPYFPQRVCASSSTEQSFSLVRCLWFAWQCFAGFFGCGLARRLGFVWGTY